MVWIAIAIAIPVSIFSKEIIGIVFGMQYLQAHGVLAVHCWSALFVFIGLVSNQWFILENLSRYTLYRHLLAAGTNIVLNMLFIPAYGIVGAAVATLLTQVITSYLFDIINKPTRILFVMKSKYLFLFLPITLKFVLQGLFKRDRLRY
ncbi:MAG: hypothetical protein C0623_00725 [Desulfuromonas sp.]|nr:MAG: hypothetical protein C0623_00725 [Desulfuromonas sp.]